MVIFYVSIYTLQDSVNQSGQAADIGMLSLVVFCSTIAILNLKMLTDINTI